MGVRLGVWLGVGWVEGSGVWMGGGVGVWFGGEVGCVVGCEVGCEVGCVAGWRGRVCSWGVRVRVRVCGWV